MATEPNTRQYLQTVERQVHRRFDMVYRFHGVEDQIPTDDERAVVHDGHILHVSIDARTHGPTGRRIAWTDVASGVFDQSLIADARGIASLNVPVFVTFDHEPDQPQRAQSGAPPDFIAAWRHVHDVFTRAGATNASWVWVVTGNAPTFTVAGRTWPGNDYVDWISWEAYNASGCRSGQSDPSLFQNFAASVLPFYDWVHLHGASLGIDTTKPMMISEAATAIFGTDQRRAAGWYRQIPEVLKSHPQIKAFGLWDRPGNGACHYQFDRVPEVVSALAEVGTQATIRGA